MPAPSAPTARSVLAVLPKERLADLARTLGVVLPTRETKDAQLDALLAAAPLPFRELLRSLGRDELRAACRAHGLDDTGRARPLLQARLLEAHGAPESAPPPALFTPHKAPRYAPAIGDIVQARHRQWLVEDVTAPPAAGHKTAVRLVCLDDDNAGQVLDALWELELGARVLHPETQGLGEVRGIDPPRAFGAYLHALKWSSVTATEANLFQSPFRAGIQLFNHQLTPLKKALSLPRANLFIADDVGLGKTIEAGLILQELLLRQRVELVVIVCPASVCLQWRDEMQKRFGLSFELMSRAFIARRRQERGFGVNPWSTHNRFIVSHSTLARPEYRDPLLQHIGERAKKSLLILDEAHTAAPSTASKYAIDSRITRVIRDVAPRFENRLFLSATPHNGHSNSFSALLEILDPQRFTRGVPVRSVQQLEPVMVRRLKEDLRKLGMQFPLRRVVPVTIDASAAECPELQLSEQLAEYTALMKPEKGQGRLVFINLQKRLLSSVEAFARTLAHHQRAVLSGKAKTQLQLTQSLQATLPLQRAALDDGEDPYGPDEDALDASDAEQLAAASAQLPTPEGHARALLDALLRGAEQSRSRPDHKALALLDWIRAHQCAGVKLGSAHDSEPPQARGRKAGVRAANAWSDTRILIFTEYADTKRYLQLLLAAAVEGTDRGDERILTLHGGMGDEQRDEVQRAFNTPPSEHPVRILIATDAAREGVNLQAHCADLFHYDIPWNPARMEQRNGRIDRTLQPAPEVRCHYFVYSQRSEDRVLQTLVQKVDVIQRELGSLGAVVLEDLDAAMHERPLDGDTQARLDAAEARAASRAHRATTAAELEAQRVNLDKVRAEIEEAGAILNHSRAITDFESDLLRDALDVGLELSGAQKLAPVESKTPTALRAFRVPELSDSWQPTLDTLRPARARDESFWDWRKRAPMPVIFEPPPGMSSGLAQLHLAHPFVQRVMGRFLAQGYSAHDLSRVTIVRTRHDSLVRVIAFGRLSLFGKRAARLHDQLVSVAARWVEGSEQELRPFAEDADRKAIDLLERVLAESPTLQGIAPAVQARVCAAAPKLMAALWPHIEAEADARAQACIQMLRKRGADESQALTEIISAQRLAITEQMERSVQLALDLDDATKAERDQFESDKKHMQERLVSIQRELEQEPPEIRALYDVALHRLQPVGLVVLWPETRG